MALSRLTAWVANQILTRNALVAEFDNIYNNALSLISPLTGNLNANLKQITNLLFETQASSQSAATEGRVYYQTSEDQVHVDDGTNIRRVPTIASVTRGDRIAASANNQWARVALGSTGTVPISDGTDLVNSTIRLPNSALTNGQLIVGSTGAAAAAATLTEGAGIDITNGAGTITIASSQLSGLSSVQFVRKTSNVTIQSDNSLNNDAELLVALAANEVVAFECSIHWASGATPDIQFAFTVPAAATVRYGLAGVFLDSGGTATQQLSVSTSGTAITLGGSGNDHHTMIVGTVANGANAGNLTLQWAQGTSDASNTTVYANSWLKVYRV